MCLYNMPLHKVTSPIAKPSHITLTISHETSVVFFHVCMPHHTVAPQTDPAFLTTDWKLMLMTFQLVATGKPLITDGALFAVEVWLG